MEHELTAVAKIREIEREVAQAHRLAALRRDLRDQERPQEPPQSPPGYLRPLRQAPNGGPC